MITAWRHSLHEIAETAFAEHRTAQFIADTLRTLDVDVTTGIGGTGVVGTLAIWPLGPARSWPGRTTSPSP